MSRRAFVVSGELLRKRLGISNESIVLDVSVDHGIGCVRIIVDDPNAAPVPECGALINEPIEDART